MDLGVVGLQPWARDHDTPSPSDGKTDVKLRAFIGSSSESLNIANAVKHHFGDALACTVWSDSFFKLSRSTLSTLKLRVDEFDLGIFIFSEDDLVVSRSADYSATRDNVVFEHGLFCGRLGPERTIVLRPRSKDLKWLSYLEGFTPAIYDEELAKTDADQAVGPACAQIRQHLREIFPRPGIYVHVERSALGQGWWTYGAIDSSTIKNDEDGIELATASDIGLSYPRFDNLDARGKWCAFRLKATAQVSRAARLYISLRAGDDSILIALSDSYRKSGWGNPSNEFKAKLPRIDDGGWHMIKIDFDEFEPYVGRISAIRGFRLRTGLKLSHVCIFDDVPSWLGGAFVVSPSDAPLVSITRPSSYANVQLYETIEGQFKNTEKIQVLVYGATVFGIHKDL
jgi:predicted nucleotide-binding protein